MHATRSPRSMHATRESSRAAREPLESRSRHPREPLESRSGVVGYLAVPSPVKVPLPSGEATAPPRSASSPPAACSAAPRARALACSPLLRRLCVTLRIRRENIRRDGFDGCAILARSCGSAAAASTAALAPAPRARAARSLLLIRACRSLILLPLYSLPPMQMQREADTMLRRRRSVFVDRCSTTWREWSSRSRPR